MKKNILILFLIQFLFSCTTDEYGNTQLTTGGWVILVIVIVLLLYIAITGSKENAKQWKKLNKLGINQSDMISVGTYAGGHPDADNTLKYAVAYKHKENIQIAVRVGVEPPANHFKILIESIKNISVEDSTTIQKKVTLGRVLLIGVFALAWRKNKKEGFAFVTIDWNDGKFDHSTIFSFEGKDAMQKANTARNKLIKIVR